MNRFTRVLCISILFTIHTCRFFRRKVCNVCVFIDFLVDDRVFWNRRTMIVWRSLRVVVAVAVIIRIAVILVDWILTPEIICTFFVAAVIAIAASSCKLYCCCCFCIKRSINAWGEKKKQKSRERVLTWLSFKILFMWLWIECSIILRRVNVLMMMERSAWREESLLLVQDSSEALACHLVGWTLVSEWIELEHLFSLIVLCLLLEYLPWLSALRIIKFIHERRHGALSILLDGWLRRSTSWLRGVSHWVLHLK